MQRLTKASGRSRSSFVVMTMSSRLGIAVSFFDVMGGSAVHGFSHSRRTTRCSMGVTVNSFEPSGTRSPLGTSGSALSISSISTTAHSWLRVSLSSLRGRTAFRARFNWAGSFAPRSAAVDGSKTPEHSRLDVVVVHERGVALVSDLRVRETRDGVVLPKEILSAGTRGDHLLEILPPEVTGHERGEGRLARLPEDRAREAVVRSRARPRERA